MNARAAVEHRLRRGIQRAVHRAGVDIKRRGPQVQFELRRAQLLAEGGFGVVVDVGANHGDYGAQLRRCGYNRRIVSFEPLAEPFRRLQRRAIGDASWICHQMALGTEPATLKLNIAANGGASSSFLDMSSGLHAMDASVRYVGSQDVLVSTLDDIADDVIGPNDRVWLKIDVQGYELQVLDGGRQALGKADGIEIEMSLVALYDGQPLMRDVLDVLQTYGFELVDLAPEYQDPVSGRVLQVNGIALRRA
jgi:FkbM family methyltransferase